MPIVYTSGDAGDRGPRRWGQAIHRETVRSCFGGATLRTMCVSTGISEPDNRNPIGLLHRRQRVSLSLLRRHYIEFEMIAGGA